MVAELKAISNSVIEIYHTTNDRKFNSNHENIETKAPQTIGRGPLQPEAPPLPKDLANWYELAKDKITSAAIFS